jgi:hypothetical protein
MFDYVPRKEAATAGLACTGPTKKSKKSKNGGPGSLCLLATFVMGFGLMMWQLITQLLAAVC